MKRTITGPIRVRNELRHLQLAAFSVEENDSDWGGCVRAPFFWRSLNRCDPKPYVDGHWADPKKHPFLFTWLLTKPGNLSFMGGSTQ